MNTIRNILHKLLAAFLSFVRLVGRTSVYLACALVTVFLLANSYETAFGQPLPYVHAIERVNLSFIQPNPDQMIATLPRQSSNTFSGNYGVVTQMKISATNKSIVVAPPIYHQHSWLARASTAHSIIVSPAKNGNIGDSIIYTVSSQTTVSDPDLNKINPGTNIYLYTKNNWRYLYRTDEVVSINDSSPKYVLSQATQSHLYVVVQTATAHDIIAATLTNVQSADQQ